MFNFSETTARFFFIYLAECILGLVLYFIFRHFGKLYRRRFLFSWALSWLAFAVYMFVTGIITVFILHSQSAFRIVASGIAQFACFLQVIMILRGTHELIYERAFDRTRFKFILLLAAGIAIISVLLFSQDPNAASYRHMIRIGSRTLTMGLGFLITGIVVWTNRKFSQGFGRGMLAGAFIMYSFFQTYNFIVVLLNTINIKIRLPQFFGIVDLLLIALIGIGMVMWLLEDERQKLEKANKELDRFLYSTSHDLRAPIASILGLTYLGKIEFQEEKARMFMDMIEERIKKLDVVIGDILSLSRSKKLDVKFEEIQLSTLLEDTITDIKFNKGASAIALDYAPDKGHVFKSDYNQMKIVLGNLLGNAVKYHNLKQARPYIRVGFRRIEGAVEIEVEDNGQGIPEESIPKIFDMFYRASLNTEGTGLGLYIVKEALSKIKGSISVKSEIGKGSLFTVVLDGA